MVCQRLRTTHFAKVGAGFRPRATFDLGSSFALCSRDRWMIVGALVVDLRATKWLSMTKSKGGVETLHHSGHTCAPLAFAIGPVGDDA